MVSPCLTITRVQNILPTSLDPNRVDSQVPVLLDRDAFTVQRKALSPVRAYRRLQARGRL